MGYDPSTRIDREEIAPGHISATGKREKTVAFIDFVLNRYVEGGVSNLNRSKVRDYAVMLYGSPAELASNLAVMQAAIDAYVGFQKHLYKPSN